MFRSIGAPDLDFDSYNACSRSNFHPRFTRDRNRIHGIGDHCATDSKIIFSNSVSNYVSSFPTIRGAFTIPNRLFDGIYTQMHRAEMTSQFTSNRSFSGRRQAAENDERRFQSIAGDHKEEKRGRDCLALF